MLVTQKGAAAGLREVSRPSTWTTARRHRWQHPWICKAWIMCARVTSGDIVSIIRNKKQHVLKAAQINLSYCQANAGLNTVCIPSPCACYCSRSSPFTYCYNCKSTDQSSAYSTYRMSISLKSLQNDRTVLAVQAASGRLQGGKTLLQVMRVSAACAFMFRMHSV